MKDKVSPALCAILILQWWVQQALCNRRFPQDTNLIPVRYFQARLDQIFMSLWYILSILIIIGLVSISFSAFVTSGATFVLGEYHLLILVGRICT